MSDLFNSLENTNATNTDCPDCTEDTTFKEPEDLKVVFYNDDFTTMDFVVDILVAIFNKTRPEAQILMQSIHKNGKCIVGKYSYDIAISRTNLTKQIARKNGFPLKVEVE